MQKADMTSETTPAEVLKDMLKKEAGVIASLTSTPSSKPMGGHRVILDISPSAIFKVLLTVATLWLLVHIFPVLLLIILSLMLVATFNPFVRKLQSRMRRSWAIVSIVTGVIVVFLGAFALMIPPLISQGLNIYQRAPQYTHQLQQAFAKHHIRVNIERQVEQIVGDPSKGTLPVMTVLTSVAKGVTAFATVAILTIYLLIEGPEVSMSLMRLLPRKERLGARKLVSQIGLQVGGYMRGQIITSALAGAFSFITLSLLGVPEALALGALAAIADVIPIIGILIALLPATLMALTLSPAKAGIVFVAYIIYHQLESNLIGPKVYGDTLGLSLSAIVISILIGVELMGILGATLALPVAAAIPSIMAYIQEWHESHQASDQEPHLP